MTFTEWLRAPREAIADKAEDPSTYLNFLRWVKLRRSLRIKLMLFGSLITALGLVFPWYMVNIAVGNLVYQGEVIRESREFVNGLNMLTNANEVGDSLTADGVKYLLIALLLTVVNALILFLVNPQIGSGKLLIARRVTSAIQNTGHLLAIGLFIRDEWWANFGGGYQAAIRSSMYLDNGATDFARALARSTFVFPTGGFTLTVLGAAIMAAGLYTSTRELSQTEAEALAVKRDDASRKRIRPIAWVGIAAPVLVCLVCATIYYGQASTWKERWAADAIAKAGDVEPVVFSVGQDHGLGILKPGFPSSRSVDCRTGQPTGDAGFEPAEAAPAGLTFDSARNQYTYAWKTNPSWEETCRELYLGFTEAVPDVGDAMLVVNVWFRQ